jgi:hypothetical protein
MLFMTTQRDILDAHSESLPECRNTVCHAKGFLNRNHLCFAERPVQGAGDNVFVADFDPELVEPYGYDDTFRRAELRFFAVPHEVVRGVAKQRKTFFQATGRAWNEVQVALLEKPALHNPRLLRRESALWASRDGIFDALVTDAERDRLGDFQRLSFTVTGTARYDPERDYLIIERRDYTQGAGGEKEDWEVKTIAGTTPQWAIFPQAWKEWAWDEEVRRSATDYIANLVPLVAPDVSAAESLGTDAADYADAWRAIARRIEAHWRGIGLEIALGGLPSRSMTSKLALPQRIAIKLSEVAPFAPWSPPRPKPVSANPESSGRVLLANDTGPFPSSGLGLRRERTARR